MSLFGVVQTALMLAALAGSFFNARKMRVCFSLWIVCNTGWMIIDVRLGLYPRAVQDLVQLCFTIYGWIYWGREEK